MASTIRGDDGFDSAQYVNLLNTYAGRNLIINGDFQVWQRNTTQSSSGYGSDDRWSNRNSGSTKSHDLMTFTPGSCPGLETAYYSRTTVTAGGGTSDYVSKLQKIEDVRTAAGRTVTISFWAKSPTATAMTIEFAQVFGSGGSTAVGGIGINKIVLTSDWTFYEYQVAIPSVSGKTIGTESYLKLTFWLDAGSDYHASTDSLGHQSGSFDISQIQLEVGSTATAYEQKTYAQELLDCQRYYEKSYRMDQFPGVASTATVSSKAIGTSSTANQSSLNITSYFKVRKAKTSGTVNLYNHTTGASNEFRSLVSGVTATASYGITDVAIRIFNTSATTDGHVYAIQWTVDAEL